MVDYPNLIIFLAINDAIKQVECKVQEEGVARPAAPRAMQANVGNAMVVHVPARARMHVRTFVHLYIHIHINAYIRVYIYVNRFGWPAGGG